MDLVHAPSTRKRGLFAAAIVLFFQMVVVFGAAAELPADFHRGAVYSSWNGSYPVTSAHGDHLAHFKAQGIEWLQLMTFAHQPDVNQPTIRSVRSAWPSAFIAKARAAGFKVLVKPHVFSSQFYDGSKRWRGSIVMKSEADWALWFAQYESFIVDQAKRATADKVEMLSIGLEYVEATRGHAAEWRRIIKAVRAVYSGTLTYAADYNHETPNITWWDALDVIGVNGYFKMSDHISPDMPGLIMGILPHFAKLRLLAEKFKKPIVFTEIGFPSVPSAAIRPWQWPDGSEGPDHTLQARLFETAFAACSRAKWCGGMYWWKYYEAPEKTPHAIDYTPKGKPAEAVMRRWYTARAAAK